MEGALGRGRVAPCSEENMPHLEFDGDTRSSSPTTDLVTDLVTNCCPRDLVDDSGTWKEPAHAGAAEYHLTS